MGSLGRNSFLLLTVFVESLLLVAIEVRVSVRVALYFNRSCGGREKEGEGGGKRWKGGQVLAAVLIIAKIAS